MYFLKCHLSLLLWQVEITLIFFSSLSYKWHQWRTEGGIWGDSIPPKIPEALQNRAKLNPVVKTVKNYWI